MKRYIRSVVIPPSDEDYGVRLALAVDTDASPAILDSLSNSIREGDYDLTRYISRHPNTSVDTLRNLSDRFPYSEATFYLAQRPEVSGDELDKIIDEFWMDHEIMYAVVMNPNITEEQIRKVAQHGIRNNDDYFDVCWELSKSPKTPPEILAALSHHFDYSVREHVFDNPNTPREVKQEMREEWGWGE